MTNPVDVITYYAWKILGFPPNRVMGQAGVLDTARFKYFISQELNEDEISLLKKSANVYKESLKELRDLM